MKKTHDLPTGTVLRAVNLHAHSTASDGQLAPEEIAAWAEQHDIYVGITDHNSVDAHRTLRSPRVLPGVEVTAGRAGVDVLVYGERKELISWFDARVAPLLDARHPHMTPIAREVSDVVEDALAAGLHVIIPHLAIPDGIGFLGAEERDRIGRLPVFIELNGQLSAKRNARAADFARGYDLPLIAADDTHVGDYGRTLTYVPLSADKAVTVAAVLAAVRAMPAACSFKIRKPTAREHARLVLNALRKVGIVTMIRNTASKTLYRLSRPLAGRSAGQIPVLDELIPATAEVLADRE